MLDVILTMLPLNLSSRWSVDGTGGALLSHLRCLKSGFETVYDLRLLLYINFRAFILRV